MFERGGGVQKGSGGPPPEEKYSEFPISVPKMDYFNQNDSKVWNILLFFCQQGGGGISPPVVLSAPPPLAETLPCIYAFKRISEKIK